MSGSGPGTAAAKQRAGRKKAPRSLPRVAVMTMARDEGPMLLRWRDHYAAQVGMENLHVFDDNSVDGSTDDLGCPVQRLPELPGRGGYERARMDLMSDFAAKLLDTNDVVVFVDVDEFLVADPARYAGLREYLAARPRRQAIAPVALNVVHHFGVEADIDPARPVLEQRRLAKFVPVMCKPSVKRVAAPWRSASHGILAPFRIDPQLFMLHLKFYDLAHLELMARRRRKQNAKDGRATASSWSQSHRRLTRMMTKLVDGVDPDQLPEFDPSAANLRWIVRKGDDGLYRTSGRGQVEAMRTLPFVRIPERLVGTL